MPTREGTTLSRFSPEAVTALGGPAWLAERRAAAWDRFLARPMPTEAEEIWRYSGIDDFDLDRYAPVAVEGPDGSGPLVARARALADELGARAALVVTVDGRVVLVEPSGAVAPGVACGSLAAAPGAGGQPPAGSVPDVVGPEVLGSVAAASDAFGELHDAFMADAAVVTVGAGSRPGAPVVVVHLVRHPAVDGRDVAVFPRTVVRVDGGASGGVVELVAPAAAPGAPGAGDGSGPLVVPVTELQVADGGHLAYAALQLLGPAATQIAVQASRVGRDAELRSMALTAGGGFARLRTDAVVEGAGGSTALLAAFLGTGDQVLDFRTTQEHAAPHTSSELLFKGAVADRARSVYSGLIRIRRGARGTSARQTNHNLVLSEGARADSVPNLDIEENDVRCSHASTVGPIDEEQRYYLQSRGIEPAVADRLVVAGFFADLARRSPLSGAAAFVERTIDRRLAATLPGGARPAAPRGSGRG